jgi:BirA family biotin operon repressor/biotin-[acetyl-CoA-carboxylase] ligase
MSRRTEKPFWDPDELQALLRTRVLGRNLVVFNRITSTNDFLKRLAQRGAAEGATVLADEQTSGRGRLGRKWQSPPGKGLWFSFLLRPQLPLDKVGVISLAIAALIAETLTQQCGADFRVKWPNDVLVDGKKVCGILCETQMSPTSVEAVIAGVGLNVLQEKEDFAPEWREPATSLRLAGSSNCDRKALFAELLACFDQNLFGGLKQRLPQLLAQWCARCEGLGEPVTVLPASAGEIPIEGTTGIFESIGEAGELIVRLPSGGLRFFSAGEITLARKTA